MNNRCLKDLQKQHNRIVTEKYRSYDLASFYAYIISFANFDENYIELSSNETQSGHAEILELYEENYYE